MAKGTLFVCSHTEQHPLWHGLDAAKKGDNDGLKKSESQTHLLQIDTVNTATNG